jgi:plastocyanin
MNKKSMHNKRIFAGALVFSIAAIFVLLGFIPSTANDVTAQTGSMATL